MRIQLNNKGQANPAPTYGRGWLALFTAILGLAITFTLSCSGGDDCGGGGSGGISDLSTQLYFIEYDDNDKYVLSGESNDNADIMWRIWKDDFDDSYDSLLVGKIQNGKIALDLYIDNKYLEKISTPCEEDLNDPHPPGYVCKDKLNYPKDLYIGVGDFYFSTPEKGKCGIYLFAESGKAFITYFSKSGKFTGTLEETRWWNGYCDGDECKYELGPTDTETYDMNFSAGWNVMYAVETGENKETVSTNKSVLKGEEPKWVAKCRNNDDDE
jgi:hypothetical protein